MHVKRETRERLVAMFQLPKTGVTEMQRINGMNEVKSDGYSHADLAQMTLERMNEKLLELGVTPPSGADIFLTFHGLVSLLEMEPEPQAEPSPEPTPEPVPESKKKAGRPKKVKADADVR